MSKRRKFILLLFLLLLSSEALLGQSSLQFPRVIASSSVYTGFAVGNPNVSAASVTFTAFQPDGTALSGTGVHNPVTVTIPPAGQYARLFQEVFGVSSFNGWVQASSSTAGLTGFFINGNNAQTDLNGAGSNAPAVDVILPLMAEDSIAKTEVTLLNVNPGTASVVLTLYGSGGNVILTKNVTLVARGLVRQTLATLLGASDFSAASHLRVQSDRPVIAHEVVADFQIPGTTLRRETGALTGHAATSATTYAIPQFASGAGWLSLIGLVNASGLAQDVTLTAYKEDGTLSTGTTNPRRVTLQPNAALRTTAGDLFGLSSSTLSTGWIQVSSTQGFVTSYIGFGNSLTPSFALVEATPLGDASRYAVFSHVAEGAGFYTGLAVLNPGSQSADVEFYTLRADGSTVGRATLTVGPNQRVSRLFRELLPASLEQVGGWGYLRSSRPVIGAVLFGTSNGYALANVPQQLPAGDFLPPALTTGTITGTVRSSGAGVAGVQIALTGPVNTIRSTDDAGRFVFTQLPAGTYKVVATRMGAVVVPSERNVTVNKQNVDGVDFEAGGVASANAPTVSLISPLSAFVGNSSLNLRVFGTNFTPASVVRVNGVAVPTTFVSAAELNAAILASFLGQAGTLRVTVETTPPGGGVSAVTNFTVNNVPSNPLLAGRVGVGSFPAGVAIDVSRRRALVTNQSTDTVTVLDLSTLQVVTEISVGRNPAEGIDIHPGKDIALVANVGSNDVSVIDLKTNRANGATIKVGHFPVGVAINAVTNRAYVVNGEDNNVSVISLDTLEVIGTIAVGTRPGSIAINPKTNQAVVTNRGSNNVTVLDLANGSSLGTVAVGEFPRGVAINPNTNQAVVVNAGANSITVINLDSRSSAGTMNVGAGPTSVGIHLATNAAVISNSAITRASPNATGVSTVSIINLDRLEELKTVDVGSAPFGVAIDQEQQMALVANFSSNDLAVVRIPNAVPQISDIDPKTFPAGGGSFTLTVRGSGFGPSSVLTLNGQALPTTFVSSKELRGVVSAAIVNQLLQVHSASTESGKGTVSSATIEFNITVENPGPGGGGSPPPKNAGANQIQVENLPAVLLSISPTEIQAGSADLVLTLNGTNFNETSIINFGGLQLSRSSGSLTTMTAFIPRAQLTAGLVPVSVTNPPLGGGTSAVLNFRVNAVENPAPSITTVNPSSIPVGAGATTVVVSGTGFISSTTGNLAGTSGTLSSGTLTFALLASQADNAGTLNGIVSTPAPGGGTATFSVSVLNPAPTIGAFTPDATAAGASTLSIDVSGGNFVRNSEILIADTPIPTTFVSANLLRGSVATGILATPGDLRIAVRNPAPGGGTASGSVFKIFGAPTAVSIAPAAGTQGTAVPVTITGANFVSGATVAVSGAGVTVGAVSVSNPNSLSTTFTIDSTAAVGPRSVTVSTTAGTSGAVTFTVNLPVPTVTSISPVAGLQGATVPVVLTGTGFISGATLSISGTGVTQGTLTVVSPTSINATLAIDPAASVGPRDIRVITAGGTSGPVVFSVDPASPTLTSISPAVGTQGATVSATLTGTNFVAGATSVLVGGTGVSAVTVNVLSSTTISVVFSISQSASPGVHNVTVVTSGGSSGSLPFTVNAAFAGSVFQGGISTSWSDPANWVPAGVPTATTNVLIPATATRQPLLASSSPVLNITVDPGATLTIDESTLQVNGNVDSGGTILGIFGGIVSMVGTGTMRGNLPSVVVSGNVTAPALTTTTITGGLTVNAGLVDVVGTVTVTQNFSTTSSGILKMTAGTANFTVNGSVTFGGGDTTGQLTAGTLRVRGIFSSSTAPTAFSPSGTHTTLFEGSSAQLVNFGLPSATDQHFQNLTVNNAAGVILNTNVYINGNATVNSGNVTGGFSVIGGNLIDSVGGRWQPITTALTGTPTTIPQAMSTNLSVFGTLVLPVNLNLTGNLTVNGSLDIAGRTALVTGNFVTASPGVLRMQTVGGTLTVNGNTTFNGGSETGLITAGVMNVRGNFDAGGSSFINYVATGTHTTILNGTTSQTVNMTTPGVTTQRFQNLQLNNTAGVVFTSSVQVSGNLDVAASVGVTGTSVISVVGNLTTGAGSSMTNTGITLGGSMTVGGVFSPFNTTFNGSVQTIQAGLGYQNIFVSCTCAVSFSATAPTTLTGNLSVTDGSLDLSSASITVNGNFITSNTGVLRMQNGSALLTVNGITQFNGGSTLGLLTQGTLDVRGPFVAGGSSSTNFTASGTHSTVFSGTSSQTVNMSFPGATTQHFGNLQLANNAGVVFATGSQVNGVVAVTAGTISGTGFLTVVGNITTAAGTSITITGLSLGATMTVGGSFSPINTTFNGTGQVIQAGLAYQNVFVTGTATFPSLPTTFTGNLTVSSGNLNVAGANLTVNGALSISGTGTLSMQNSIGVLTVNGSATFNGASAIGLLSAGTLNLRGSFTAGGSSSTNFSAIGTHTTILNGTLSQVVSMTFPGQTSQHFQNLQIANTAGVVFSANAEVTGTLAVGAGSLLTGLGSTVTVEGAMTTAAGSLVTVSGVTLAGTLTALGTFSPTTTTFSGVNQTIPAGVSYINVTVIGTATFSNNPPISIGGNLLISSGNVNVADANVSVGGNLDTSGAGTLTMQNVGGVLTVGGTATFNGASALGLLSAGSLYLRGNFSAGGSSTTNFAATGTLLTTFDGTSQQTISMTFPGPLNQRFQDLVLNNPAGVVFATGVQINGNVTLVPGNPTGNATGPGPVTLNGNLIDTSGGHWLPTNTVLSGSPTTLPSFLTTNLTVSGDMLAPVSMELFGSLIVDGSNALLDFSCRSWDIHGDLTTSNGGVINMSNPSECSPFVTVRGNATFNGGSTLGELTAGSLYIYGNFSAGASSPTNFAPTGFHLTQFNGSTPQTISMALPGSTQQRFVNLRLNNTAGVSFNSAVQVNGDVTLMTGAATGTGPVTLAQSLFDNQTGGTWQVGSTIFSGSPSALPGQVIGNVTITGNFATPGVVDGFFIVGNLTVTGPSASLDLRCENWDVSGNFLTSGNGVLKMMTPFAQECSPFLYVQGQAQFAGGSTDGFLTSGEMYVGGDFIATGSAQSFAASGEHYTYLVPDAPRLVSMSSPGPTQQRFNNLFINTTAQVSFVTAAQVNGDVEIGVFESNGPAVGFGPVTIGGYLYDYIGDLWRVQNTIFSGNPSSVPEEMTTNLTFAPTTPQTISLTSLVLNGNLTVSGTGAILDVTCGDVSVIGNFMTTAGGALKMTDPGGCSFQNLYVEGDVTFAGGSTEGLLTGGILNVTGNFTATNSSPTSFAATDSHVTWLSGTGAQTINLATPGAANQRFQELYVFNLSPAGVTLASDVYVTSAFGDDWGWEAPQGTQHIFGGGHTLTVGDFWANDIFFDNTPLVLDVADRGFYNFDQVYFENYADSATRVTVRGTSLDDYTLYGVHFLDPLPTTGHLLNVTDTDGGGDFSLYIQLSSSDASINTTNAEANTVKVGGATSHWFVP